MTSINNRNLSWAEIDLNALHHNLDMVRNQLNTKTRIMAVVKANAYGHGAVEISRALLEYGIDAIAVATVGEAAELREHGINIPILILGSIAQPEIELLFDQHLVPTLNNPETAGRLNEWARQRGQKIKVHLRIDTGMGSYGLLPDKCLQMIDTIVKMDYLELTGIYTHINTIYGGKLEDSLEQLKTFDHLLSQLEQKGIHPPMVHACSSPAVLKLPQAEYDMVRLGIVLYGLPCGNDFLDNQLRPVMQIKTSLAAIKAVASNFGLGYGWTSTTNNPALIATLPIGYADAAFLHFLREGEVLIRGQRAPIIGKACMDHLIVDVSNIIDAAVGDEAVILGEQGDQRIKAEEIALRSGIDLNNIDMVCLLGSRVSLVYKH